MGGLINTVVEIGTFGLVDDITGTEAAQDAALGAAQTQADAGQAAIDELRRSKEEAVGYIDPSATKEHLRAGATSANAQLALGEDRAQGFLTPFSQVGQQGIDNASILTDSQAQYDWLQNNPLFQSALDNANQNTMNLAASRGRISAGDTLGALSNNTLLAASPLLAQQQQNVSNLLGFGAGIAGQQSGLASNLGSQQANFANNLGINLANTEQSSQQALANAALGTGTQIGNLTTDIGAALAGGQVGAANVTTDFNNSLLGLGGAYLGGI